MTSAEFRNWSRSPARQRCFDVTYCFAIFIVESDFVIQVVFKKCNSVLT